EENVASKQIDISEGVTTIHLRATDVAGNESSMDTLTLKYDKTAPVLDSINDMTVEATSAAGAAVTLPTAHATDNLSDVDIQLSHTSGDTFPLGETTVTVTAKDEAGNSSQTTFKVKVVDTTPPTIHGVPADITMEATGPAS